MAKPIAAKFKVTINEGHNELYEVFKELPPYYRQKRLLQLAAMGLAVEQGRFVAGGQVAPVQSFPAPSSLPQRPTQRKKSAPSASVCTTTKADVRHYKANPNATDLLAGILGGLGAFDEPE